MSLSVKKLEPVLAFFGHHDGAIPAHSNSGGKIQSAWLKSIFTKLGQKLSILIENLNTLIVPVGHVNISFPVQRQTNGKFHETIEISGKPEAENKFAIIVIPFDAMVRSIRNEDGPGRFRNNILEFQGL